MTNYSYIISQMIKEFDLTKDPKALTAKLQHLYLTLDDEKNNHTKHIAQQISNAQKSIETLIFHLKQLY